MQEAIRRPLKVGYLIKRPIDPRGGKAEFNRALAVKALFTRRGHRLTVFAGFVDDGQRFRSAAARCLAKFLAPIEDIRRAARRYASGIEMSDLVVLSITGPRTALAGWLALRHSGRPIVLHIADVPSLQELEKAGHSVAARVKWCWLRAVEKRLCARADHIVAASPRYKSALVALGVDAAKISILPNAVDVRRLRGAVARPGGAAGWFGRPGGFRVIYAGEMGDAQGLDIVLSVATELQDEPIEFLMVGDGPARAALERRTRKERLRNVTFTGGMPFDRAARLMAAAEVALVVLDEGLQSPIPSKFYIALSLRTPVLGIGAAESALADLLALTDCGLMLPRRPEAIAAALRGLLRQPQTLARIKEYQARWQESFDGDRVYLHLARIAEALADRRQVAPLDGFEALAEAIGRAEFESGLYDTRAAGR